MAVEVNTAAITATADRIDALNKQIQEELRDVEASIHNLYRCWEGSAASSCVNKFDHLNRNLAEARYANMNAFVLFLKRQIGEGYEQTEGSVTSAALAFK